MIAEACGRRCCCYDSCYRHYSVESCLLLVEYLVVVLSFSVFSFLPSFSSLVLWVSRYPYSPSEDDGFTPPRGALWEQVRAVVVVVVVAVVAIAWRSS